MKKIAAVLLLAVIAGCSSGPVAREFRPERIVHFSRLQKMKNIADIGSHAVYLERGDRFPFDLVVESDIIGLSEKRVHIVMKQRLYFMVKLPESATKESLERLEALDREAFIRMGDAEREKLFRGYMLFVSRDARTWAPLGDMAAVRSVLGIRGGTVSLGLGMSRKDGVLAHLILRTLK